MRKKVKEEAMERDKRKFKRFDAYMSVKFTGTESTSVKGIGLSRDLCREGLKINSLNTLSLSLSRHRHANSGRA